MQLPIPITAEFPLTVPAALPLRLLLFCGHFLPFSLDVDENGGVLIPTTIEWLWHRRLGYPGYHAMHRLVNGNIVKNLPLTHQQVKRLENIPCDACQKAKALRLLFPKASTSEVHAPLQRLPRFNGTFSY